MADTVLIVDDSSSMRQMVKFALTEEGYGVDEAVDGKDALEKLPSSHPKLVITDINMPNLDGIGLIKEIRASSDFKFVPIIVLTTESEQSKQEEGKKAGATAWLVKPFTPEKLIETVKKVSG
jgi:two-component system chemotaxis response regulator CheY